MPTEGDLAERQVGLNARHSEQIKRLDALCPEGVGSVGLVAISDLEDLYSASSRLTDARSRTEDISFSDEFAVEEVSDLIAARVNYDRVEGQVKLHKVTLSGYAEVYRQAETIAGNLEEVRQSVVATDAPATILYLVAGDLDGVISGAIARTP